MDPFESYKLYNALKLHFERDSYDAVKYNFKSNVSANSFFKRKDKFFFAKLAKHHGKELKMYFVSNFINDVNYVGDMINEDGERNFLSMKKTHESISRTFETDINTIGDLIDTENYNFNQFFESKNSQHPMIIKMWLEGDITLETVCILNAIFGFVDRESTNITETIMWPNVVRKITKYTPFINYDRDKLVKIMRKRIL
jgi:hypothetical protein